MRLTAFHFQIWVKDASVIDVDDDETIAKFIAQYCTCSIPDKILSPVLHERQGWGKQFVIGEANHKQIMTNG